MIHLVNLNDFYEFGLTESKPKKHQKKENFEYGSIEFLQQKY
jgi:hypothetical protein